ncbi:trypsin-like peptidase domain-containing protein [Streptomyces sp. NA04227]|uniref:S1C family serine protease n=1 Tax=Streptomyces sp. NA04227 TaxID=2742136 RepID=UPI0015904031|nr:trypsin-like peptidase domain-containing protein [Streptomyces sp. NA04227]QKW07912.1 trypsin-like peptidase domain-containing protein [Streptomyces sp. NA04227]
MNTENTGDTGNAEHADGKVPPTPAPSASPVPVDSPAPSSAEQAAASGPDPDPAGAAPAAASGGSGSGSGSGSVSGSAPASSAAEQGGTGAAPQYGHGNHQAQGNHPEYGAGHQYGGGGEYQYGGGQGPQQGAAGQGPHGPGPAPQQGGWPPAPPTVPMYAGGGGGGGGGGHHWGSGYQPHQPRPKRRRGLLVALLAGALLTGAAGGGIGYLIADSKDDDSASGTSTTVNANTPAADLKRSPTSVAGIAKRALPSVVTIEASGGNGQESGGTGFVYDQEGHILTNNHVVATAAEGGKLSATFADGKKYAAEVIGRAQGYDVAVIKLRNAPDDLKPLPLANSDKVAVGDATIAIGAPFGLNNTVTTGIVSAKDRPVASSDGGTSSKASYMSALQTDASINPGNSGGPLLDSGGAVIGINSAIQSGNQGGGMDGGQAGSVGLGFAIPINQARTVASQLMKTGEPVYPVIGASVSLEGGGDGARITEEGENGAEPVTPGGPADKAGLEPGDLITELDGTVIDSGPTLIGEIWTRKPGDKVEITYERDGEEHTVDVVLGQRKGDDN